MQLKTKTYKKKFKQNLISSKSSETYIAPTTRGKIFEK